jgi:hypothetical protein
MNKSTNDIENIKYSIKNFPNYFFDGDLNLYYSKDKITFRSKKAYISKRSRGFKLHKKFYSHRFLISQKYHFNKPHYKPTF